MSMRLYSGPLSMFGAKAEIAALEKGLDVQVEMVPFDMKALYEPKHPEVLRVNPKRQVPSGWRRTTSRPRPARCTGVPSGPVPVRDQVDESKARSPVWMAVTCSMVRRGCKAMN